MFTTISVGRWCVAVGMPHYPAGVAPFFGAGAFYPCSEAAHDERRTALTRPWWSPVVATSVPFFFFRVGFDPDAPAEVGRGIDGEL